MSVKDKYYDITSQTLSLDSVVMFSQFILGSWHCWDGKFPSQWAALPLLTSIILLTSHRVQRSRQVLSTTEPEGWLQNSCFNLRLGWIYAAIVEHPHVINIFVRSIPGKSILSCAALHLCGGKKQLPHGKVHKQHPFGWLTTHQFGCASFCHSSNQSMNQLLPKFCYKNTTKVKQVHSTHCWMVPVLRIWSMKESYVFLCKGLFKKSLSFIIIHR